MKNIHIQNVTALVQYIIVFYMQELGTCFGDTGILVQHLLILGIFEAITSPLNLELSWQPSYSTVSCCLME